MRNAKEKAAIQDAIDENKTKRREEMNARQKGLQRAFQSADAGGGEHIRQLLDTSKLQDGTVAIIDTLMSKTWVLGNLTDAQEHDARYWLEVLKLRVYAMHPRRQSEITGPLRAALLDDPSEGLKPLSPSEKNEVEQAFETLKTQFTRSRQGFQQEEFSKSVAVSRAERTGEEGNSNDGVLGGVL